MRTPVMLAAIALLLVVVVINFEGAKFMCSPIGMAQASTGTVTAPDLVRASLVVDMPPRHTTARTTAHPIVTLPANDEKHLVVYAHFHGCGGTSMCHWATRASKDRSSGVKLSKQQKQHSWTNCNLEAWSPNIWTHERWLTQPEHNCTSLLALAKSEGSTWLQTETALDVTPPCRNIAFIVTIREPFKRINSVMKHEKYPKTVLRMLQLMEKMRAGDPVVGYFGNKMGNNPAIYDPVFEAGHLDNFYVRFLLGASEGRRIPWRSFSEEHFTLAKRKLELFDLVIPLEELETALPFLQCRLGSTYNVDVATDRYQWAGHSNVHAEKALKWGIPPEIEDFKRLFYVINKMDSELYAMAAERWSKRGSSPCKK